LKLAKLQRQAGQRRGLALNSGDAQILNSYFADIKGVLQDTQATGGIPLTLNGASITVVVGSVTTHPALYYTSPTQLAAVLPAATPVGTGTLTVNYRGANSASAAIQVVAVSESTPA